MSEGIPAVYEETENDIESMSREELIAHSQGLQDEIEILKRRVAHLENDSIHDDLTGLKTRRFLNEELEMYLSDTHKGKPRKEGYIHASVLFFDADYFKKINDTHGHLFGDQVLRAIAKTISEHVRGNDVVARWGGEEFGALLYGADEAEAVVKAEKIRKAIEEVRFPSNPNFTCTMSIGVSECTPGLTYEEIIHNADVALYDAKSAGRNKVVCFSELEKK